MATSPDRSSLPAKPRTMKALTIFQPYAWAIMEGIKRIENRSRPTSYRGRLAIHAGLSKDWDIDVLDDGTRVPQELEYGKVLGAVTLVDCVRVDDPKVQDDPFAHGEWCWILEAPNKLEVPVAMRGKQGLFEIDANLVLVEQPRRIQPDVQAMSLFEKQKAS